MMPNINRRLISITIAAIFFPAIFAMAGTLHEAVKSGDLAALKSLLAEKPELINATDDNGRSALYIAASGGNLEIVDWLCRNGADLEAKTPSGFTALFMALNQGRNEVAAFLINNGADINAETKYQTTPIFTAVESGNMRMVEMLMEKGADINHLSPYFGTALHRAIYMDFPELVALLIDKGARLDALDMSRQTPLHTAALLGRLEAARLLLDRGSAVNELDAENKTPLHWAIEYGTDRAGINHSRELAELLIARGAEVNTTALDGTTPLIAAVRQGYGEVVDLIINQGGEILAREPLLSRTLLHIAAIKGYADVTDLLLARGIDRNIKDQKGKTALDYALGHGNQTVVEKLVKPDKQAPAAEVGAMFLSKKLSDEEAFVWYMNNRGWAVKTGTHLFIFDNEELGRKPDRPSLANGWVAPEEIREQNVIALYSAYHALPNTLEFIHAIEDSISNIKYVHYTDDQWRGGKNSVFIAGHEIQNYNGIEIIPYETHDAGGMGSLGYLIKAEGVTFLYPNFLTEDIEAFKKEIDYLAEHTQSCDFAIVEVTPGQENLYAAYIIEKLKPGVVFPYDRSNNPAHHLELAEQLLEKYPDLGVVCALDPGDRFHIKKGKTE